MHDLMHDRLRAYSQISMCMKTPQKDVQPCKRAKQVAQDNVTT